MMKNFLALLLSIVLIASLSCHPPQQSSANTKWQSLFNGKDIKDWVVKIHHHDINVNFGNTFEQVLPMVGNFIFVRPELLPGFLIKLNIKNQSWALFVKPRTTVQQNYCC
jgi:hypothetical protein